MVNDMNQSTDSTSPFWRETMVCNDAETYQKAGKECCLAVLQAFVDGKIGTKRASSTQSSTRIGKPKKQPVKRLKATIFTT